MNEYWPDHTARSYFANQRHGRPVPHVYDANEHITTMRDEGPLYVHAFGHAVDVAEANRRHLHSRARSGYRHQ